LLWEKREYQVKSLLWEKREYQVKRDE